MSSAHNVSTGIMTLHHYLVPCHLVPTRQQDHSAHPPPEWALVLLLVEEMSAHSVSHPHLDHTVEYSLALSSNSLGRTWDPNFLTDSGHELIMGI